MFATPRTDSSARSNVRRSLLGVSSLGSGAGQPSSQANNQASDAPHNQSPAPPNVSLDGDGEVLTILRDLQEQVSILQAQQSKMVSERTSTPSSQTTTPKRKLPKELSVSVVLYRFTNLPFLNCSP